MADLLTEKQTIKPEELLDEGKFRDFTKAAALGAGLALSPLHAGETHELEVAELPADMISQYNELEEQPVLNYAVAQAMADEIITKIGDESVSMAPEETEAWGTAKATYEYLAKRDKKIATAFIGKFNTQAKRYFGNQIRPGINTESMELPISKKLNEGIFDVFRRKTETTPETPHVSFNDFVEQVKAYLRDNFEFADSAAHSAIKEFYLIVKKFYIEGKSALDTATTIDDEFLTNDPTWWKRYKDAPMKEAFIKDDRGKVSEEEIAQAIVARAGATGNVYYLDVARYIAAFYTKQSLPKNGMIMWGLRDLKSFVAKQEKDVKSAIGSTRSVMLGNPETRAEWIDKNKQEIKRERAEEAEARRQAYLNSDEYRRSQDPGWTGPRGTWTLGT